MPRGKRKAKGKAVATITPVRKRCKHRARDLPSLPDLVTLLHLQLAPFLTPRDLSRLLRCCSKLLPVDVQQSLATCGLRLLYELDGVHFGRRCIADWHQLVPEEAEGGEGFCVLCELQPPQELALPRLGDARKHLLDAACLADEGFSQICDGVLQMHFGSYATPRYGSMQPVLFSLAAALETLQSSCRSSSNIDTDNVDVLTRLMDSVRMGFGTQFFSNRKQHCTPTNAVEAHWRGIQVDQHTQKATCRYCEDVAISASANRCERCTEVYARLLKQHCKALYQPLKVFMMKHLKHVRYVKPCRGWNTSDDEFHGDRMLDLIAGFTPAGVLCGVYLTDLRIPYRLVQERLAPGAFEP